jgi:hypothetical protein
MNTEFFRMKGTWRDVADSARTTIGKAAGKGEPSNAWKKRILLAEHSPIRQLLFKWKWEELPYWVSVHMVRHKIGIEHWVSTSRTDRTGIVRDGLPQDHPVAHECEANAQALITISRKRLCKQAAKETTEAWQLVIDKLSEVDPIVASVCVPECVYRGFCPEFKSCGFIASEKGKQMLEAYHSVDF